MSASPEPIAPAAPAARSSLLSDALVRSLVAAGQADVLVGIPTLNHAQTVGQVARAVVQAFSGPLARERAVLFNPDGGSTDGTAEVMLRAGNVTGDLVMASYPLRTVHRITTPYHGVPGRGSALVLIFAAADLLGARAVAVVDPEATELGAEDLAGFLRPMLDGAADFVKPVLPRRFAEGPLVTQLVRPLLRAAFGRRILEPVDTMLGCSGRFAAGTLSADIWKTPFAQYSVDPWLCSVAALGGSRIAQVAVPPHRPRRSRLDLGEVFQQVVGSVFGLLAHDPPGWTGIRDSQDVPRIGRAVSPMSSGPPFDAADYAAAFRSALDDLKPVLAGILRPEVERALEQAAKPGVVRIDDAVWVRTVYDFLMALLGKTMALDQIVQCLQPIYLGRVCSLLAEPPPVSPSAGEARHEALARTFEELKGEALERAPAARKGRG